MRVYALPILLAALLGAGMSLAYTEARGSTVRMSVLAEAPAARAPAEIAEEVAASVVRIDIYGTVPVYERVYRFYDGFVLAERERVGSMLSEIGTGSGFFVSEDGYLITNKHVVADEDATYLVDTGERQHRARVVYRDPTHDIAVLKVDGRGFAPLPLGTIEGVRRGSEVTAVGNALGMYSDSVTAGEVVALDQDITVSELTETGLEPIGELAGLIETSAKVFRGDSGGPLLNERGEVVGVNVATAVGETVGFAIPVEHARAALQKARSLED